VTIETGAEAPEFDLEIDGAERVRLADFRGRRNVLLVFRDSSAARQAWKRAVGLTYVVASDFWPHGAAARAYGVFDESKGAAVRGTFLIDKGGTVVWTLVHDADTRRTELATAPLETTPA
jgi:peroxiredoxin